MSTPKLSAYMLEALQTVVLKGKGADVVCHPGGYWTYRGCELRDGVPVWYAGTNTIRALVSRGMLELRTVPPRTFPTEGTVTAAGLALVLEIRDAVG